MKGKKMKLSKIFEEKPERWGFRGDPYFWDYLKEKAEKEKAEKQEEKKKQDEKKKQEEKKKQDEKKKKDAQAEKADKKKKQKA